MDNKQNNKQLDLIYYIIRTLNIIEDGVTFNKSTIINGSAAYILNDKDVNSVKFDIIDLKEHLSMLNDAYAHIDDNLFEYVDRTIDIIEYLIIRNHFGNVYIVDTTALNDIKQEMNTINEKLRAFIENVDK